MKKLLFVPLGIFVCAWLPACNQSTTTTSTTDSTATAAPPPATTTTTTTVTTLSEADPYLDLNSGKTIHIHKDAQSGNYMSDLGAPLVIYVNTVTHDTFYGPVGQSVNNAVMHNEGKYSIDNARLEAMQNQINAQQNQIDATQAQASDNAAAISAADTGMPAGATPQNGKTKTKTKVTEHKTKTKTKESNE